MKHDIFISYSRRNLKQVVAIKDEIKERANVDSWIDLKGIESGEQFVNVIIKAIDEAKIVLFMVSKESMVSEYSKKEVMYAKNKGKKVIPIVLDGSELSDWFLFEFGVISFVDINVPEQKTRLFENIWNWVGQGNPQELYEIGLSYYLKKQYEVAMEWFEKSAQYGNAEAEYYLGSCYSYGTGVETDYAKAMEWYTKAASHNHSEAQNKIGIFHKHGKGIPENDDKALEWFWKAADNGNVNAMYNIAKSYYYGRGIDENVAEAANWFAKAAQLGHAKAQSSLGFCYLSGEGVGRDDAKAVEWFKKAAQQGIDSAQYYLGYCYYYGLGLRKDYKKAASWFSKGTASNHLRAIYQLGLCYFYGNGVEKSLPKARMCFRKAMKHGSTEAQQFLTEHEYLSSQDRL